MKLCLWGKFTSWRKMEGRKKMKKQPEAPAKAKKLSFSPRIFYSRWKHKKKLNKQMIDLLGTWNTPGKWKGVREALQACPVSTEGYWGKIKKNEFFMRRYFQVLSKRYYLSQVTLFTGNLGKKPFAAKWKAINPESHIEKEFFSIQSYKF